MLKRASRGKSAAHAMDRRDGRAAGLPFRLVEVSELAASKSGADSERKTAAARDEARGLLKRMILSIARGMGRIELVSLQVSMRENGAPEGMVQLAGAAFRRANSMLDEERWEPSEKDVASVLACVIAAERPRPAENWKRQ